MPGRGRLRSVARWRNVRVVNHSSNTPATPDDADLSNVVGGHLDAVRGFWFGRLGQTVRCVPWRRTMFAQSGAEVLFAKLYRGRLRAAAAEWHWLQVLPQLGIEAARPVAWLGDRRSRLVVTAAVPGRSLDAWTADAQREGRLAELFAYACRHVAPLARRLHDHGLIHRDLNCAHLFLTDPRHAGPPAVIDVERMFRPRWRWRRWVIKDLASLLASVGVPVPVRVQLRFLKCYAPESSVEERRKLARDIVSKAGRVLAHQPRFG
jgi:hypothetical protein